MSLATGRDRVHGQIDEDRRQQTSVYRYGNMWGVSDHRDPMSFRLRTEHDREVSEITIQRYARLDGLTVWLDSTRTGGTGSPLDGSTVWLVSFISRAALRHQDLRIE